MPSLAHKVNNGLQLGSYLAGVRIGTQLHFYGELTATGGSGGTPAGTYTATVTGVDAATGKITANTAVTVTVN